VTLSGGMMSELSSLDWPLSGQSDPGVFLCTYWLGLSGLCSETLMDCVSMDFMADLDVLNGAVDADEVDRVER
jgi:hypothetical protein